ncbi:DUF5946 family protein [Rubrivirga sp.]|uniref:DUF5946 family protein n=1 Tax=Rubrivirga sp. TaxID=1885344 RepID=UPI003C76DF65
MTRPSLAPCPGCAGLFPDGTGPVHRYMESSPGCWAAYGRVIAREYSEPELGHVHRLSVDAYAAQHPGRPSPQSMKSVGVHLIRLCLTVEQGFDVRESNRVMVAVSKVKGRFGWLEPPESLGSVTVSHVVTAASLDDHRAAVHTWSRSVWEAWHGHHGTVRAWARSLPIP